MASGTVGRLFSHILVFTTNIHAAPYPPWQPERKAPRRARAKAARAPRPARAAPRSAVWASSRPTAKARGLEAAEVAYRMDEPGASPLLPRWFAKRAALPSAPIASRSAAARCCWRLRSAHAVQPTPFQRDLSPTHAKRLAEKIERDRGIPRSADCRARRGRAAVDSQRPPSARGRQVARPEADHRADLTGRVARLSHPRAQHREGSQPAATAASRSCAWHAVSQAPQP